MVGMFKGQQFQWEQTALDILSCRDSHALMNEIGDEFTHLTFSSRELKLQLKPVE